MEDVPAGAVVEPAASGDAPVAYIARTHDWYRALGYDAPYRYAHFADAPFVPLRKPLAQCRIAIVTTAAPFRVGRGEQGPGAPYNGSAKFHEIYSGDTTQGQDLRISHIAYDRKHTSATDMNTWFPLAALRRAAAAGRIGEIAQRFHGAPTTRSQRTAMESDAPAILRRCREDDVDAVALVPNCPVCHQTVSLVARHLEANRTSTVVMGCAKDIVELCGVPRFLFSDFPLGNSAGRPHDVASQDTTLALALDLLETAAAPRTTWQSPLRWSGDPGWKRDYMNAEMLAPEEITQLRAEFEREKRAARSTVILGRPKAGPGTHEHPPARQ